MGPGSVWGALVALIGLVVAAGGCGGDTGSAPAAGDVGAADVVVRGERDAGDDAAGHDRDAAMAADGRDREGVLADADGPRPGDDAVAGDDGDPRGDEAAPVDGEREATPVRAVWALQSTAGAGGVLTQATLARRSGAMVVSAVFSGTVTFGDHTLSTDEQGHRHQLLAEVRPDGAVGFARHVCDLCLGVLAEGPGGQLASLRGGESAAFVRLTDYGAIAARSEPALGPGWTVTALTGRPEGGWLAGGSMPAEEAFYPGRAFIAGLSADGTVEWVERIEGTAGSQTTMVAPSAEGFVAVGDFGGYPLGVTADFAGGAAVLEALSSDDDPAYDLFVARWQAPGALSWARRIQHYQNGPRNPTELDVSADQIAFRLDGAGELEEEEGEYGAGYGDGDRSLRITLDAQGVPSDLLPLPYGAQPVPDRSAHLSLRRVWREEGFRATPAGPHFPRGATLGEQDVVRHVLSEWTDRGEFVRAGAVDLHVPRDRYPLALHAAAPQTDGSLLVYWNGATPVAIPADGVDLHSTGFERLVFARLEFVSP